MFWNIITHVEIYGIIYAVFGLAVYFIYVHLERSDNTLDHKSNHLFSLNTLRSAIRAPLVAFTHVYSLGTKLVKFLFRRF